MVAGAIPTRYVVLIENVSQIYTKLSPSEESKLLYSLKYHTCLNTIELPVTIKENNKVVIYLPSSSY